MASGDVLYIVIAMHIQGSGGSLTELVIDLYMFLCGKP